MARVKVKSIAAAAGESGALKDALGLGLLIVLIASTQLMSFLVGA